MPGTGNPYRGYGCPEDPKDFKGCLMFMVIPAGIALVLVALWLSAFLSH